MTTVVIEFVKVMDYDAWPKRRLGTKGIPLIQRRHPSFSSQNSFLAACNECGNLSRLLCFDHSLKVFERIALEFANKQLANSCLTMRKNKFRCLGTFQV